MTEHLKYGRCKECGTMNADGDFCPACIAAHDRRGHSSGDGWLSFLAAAAVGLVIEFGGRLEKAIVFGLVAWFIVSRFQRLRELKPRDREEQAQRFEQEQHAMRELAEKKLAKWKKKEETRSRRPNP
jgi:hypothetical protein